MAVQKSRLQKSLTGISNPRRAAKEVINQMKANKKVSVAKAMRDVGYSKSKSYSATDVKNSPDFQEELFDFVASMEEERKQCLRELKDPKVRKKATYRDRIDAINKLTNNIQLITGQSTSNESMTIIWGDEEDAD